MPKTKQSLRLHRDTKGEIRTITGVSPNLGIEVEVLPLTYGASRLIKSFGESLYEWTDEDKIFLINNNIVQASGEQVEIKDRADLYENFDAWVIEDLLQAVFIYSGMGRLYSPESEGNVEGEAEEESST